MLLSSKSQARAKPERHSTPNTNRFVPSALLPVSPSPQPLPLARLLSMVLLGSVLGTALQLEQRALFALPAYGVLAAVCVVGLFAVFYLLAGARRWWLFAAVACLLAGGLSFGVTGLRAHMFLSAALAPSLEGQDIVMTGQVHAMPQVNEDGVRFEFKVESAALNGKSVAMPQHILLGWYSGFGMRPAKALPDTDQDPQPPEFLLQLQRQPQELRAGERWEMTVRLKAPHGNSNPHGFDYELWLWEQGVQATGYVRTSKADAPPKKLATTRAHPIERARQSVRDAIFARVDNRAMAGVLAALVVGDQRAIERADWDVFRATGVAHLMSISGLHITMFAWAAALLIAWGWRRSALATPVLCHWLPAASAGALGGLLLATLYALFSGWGLPAQRTIWMLAAVVLLRLKGRHWPWPLVWLLAMALVVALDPWALMQAGFWLSFVAVGILFAASSPAEQSATTEKNATILGAAYARRYCGKGLNDAKIPPWLAQAAAWIDATFASFAASARQQWVITLALTPLSLLLFNQVSVVGLLANAVAIPWVTLVVTPLAMLGALWAPLWNVAAAALGVLNMGLQFLASWPLASISVAAAPLWAAVAGVLGGALLAIRLPWFVRALGVPLLLPVLLWQPALPAVGQFEILAADIGQGNAVLVRTANHSLVYDTGPKFSRESDAGNRVLVPLLRAFGTDVDVLMLSHRDTDHIGGAPAVLAMQAQARLVSSIEDGHELQSIRRSERCVAGQAWRWDGVDFEVLHPLTLDYAAATKSNAMSCVLRISNGKQTALLAGDLEAAQELRLVGDPLLSPKLKADVLLMPHHGSKTSSTGPFLDAVQPRFAIAQAGYKNRFSHPVDSVLARYRERNIAVVQSPICGAATFSSQDATRVVCQREVAKRYWHHRLE
jgi:competence protein ComEC